MRDAKRGEHSVVSLGRQAPAVRRLYRGQRWRPRVVLSVDIVDEPVKVARIDGDRILLEAHRGTSGHTANHVSPYMERLRTAGVMDSMDRGAAEQVLRNTWGIAIDISKHREPGTLGMEQRAGLAMASRRSSTEDGAVAL